MQSLKAVHHNLPSVITVQLDQPAINPVRAARYGGSRRGTLAGTLKKALPEL
jgi:hypothetical protein